MVGIKRDSRGTGCRERGKGQLHEGQLTRALISDIINCVMEMSKYRVMRRCGGGASSK